MTLRLSRIELPLAEFSLEAELEMRAPVTALCGPSGAGKTRCWT
jgi:ABC-type molybdate transport system ATPase subunit